MRVRIPFDSPPPQRIKNAAIVRTDLKSILCLTFIPFRLQTAAESTYPLNRDYLRGNRLLRHKLQARNIHTRITVNGLRTSDLTRIFLY